MTAALVLILAAALLALGALADLLPRCAGPLATPSGRGRQSGGWRTLPVGRFAPRSLREAGAGGALRARLGAGSPCHQDRRFAGRAPLGRGESRRRHPPRFAWIVAIALPAGGFLGPDAWLERRARQRLRALRAGLPDALDLLAVGTAAGRSPLAGLRELGAGEGPLAQGAGDALGRELLRRAAERGPRVAAAAGTRSGGRGDVRR